MESSYHSWRKGGRGSPRVPRCSVYGVECYEVTSREKVELVSYQLREVV